MRTHKYSRQALAVALLVTAVAGCGRGDAEAQSAPQARATVRQQIGPVPAVIDTSTAAHLSGAFRGAADRALPAVVYIQSTMRRSLASNRGRMFPFQMPGQPGDGSDPQQAPAEMASGTGFIIDNQGHILTNNHVVADAERVVVRLVDGRQFDDARVVGRDPNTDVAVVQITPRAGESLPVSQLGNSDEARVGDWVIALGNPLGLDFTVTAGIVSAKGRAIGILRGENAPYALESFIQTDAAINPGNSGGPLVDLLGRVVGINSAIESPTGYFAGAGFAIPINLAMRIGGDLIKYGVVHRPRLGVQVRAVNSVDAELYGLPTITGALIASITPREPAAAAGLQVGDVITEVNGKQVDRSGDISTMLAALRPGDRAQLTYYRDKKQRQTTVTLGEFTTSGAPVATRPAPEPVSSLLGFSVTPLTPELAGRYQLSRNVNGVVITTAPRSGPAGEAGIQPGMILQSINGQNVTTTADVERIARTLHPGEIVSLRVVVPNPDIGESIFNYRTRR
jgi:serine protease Do